MEKITPSLMNFIDGDDFFKRILVVESSEYIVGLREKFPTAEIFSVTPDEDVAEKFSAQAKIFVMDYREERLPFDAEFFDAIIGDLILEVVGNPQDIAAGFSTYIKQTGVLLTSFRNLRHWKVLRKLMHGNFFGTFARLYTRQDFERLLYASFYKHVRFSPLIKKAPPEMLDTLLSCGFENLDDDLESEFWLVRAARSMPELSLLKSMFTAEIRTEFSRIIHRIEYDIDTEESVKKFWDIYDAAGMFKEYAANFIEEVVVHHENFFANFEKYSARAEEIGRAFL